MYTYELCRRYQDAINRKDLPGVLSLFVSEAVAKAPISGVLSVKEFHSRIFAHDRHGIARLKNVFDSVGRTKAVALQFDYTYVVRNGQPVAFDCITIFEKDENVKKFKSMTIIYDPTELRRHLKNAEIDDFVLG